MTLDPPSTQAGQQFGYSAAAGDINGDGRDDVVVGAAYEDVGAVTNQGRAYVFDGLTGSLIRTLDSLTPESQGRFGSAVAVADVNGDGRGDVIVGAPYEVNGRPASGRTYVFSGADGSLLYAINAPVGTGPHSFGQELAAGADADGDGRADFIVADSAADGSSGRVYLFSGATGALSRTWTSPNPQGGSYFGHGLAMGDFTGDGRSDVIASAFREDVGANGDQGRAYVFNGATGSLIRTLNLPVAQDFAQFGASVATGDVDGDGLADMAVGADLEDVGSTTFQGRAYVFSGSTGALIWTLTSPDPQSLSYFGTVAMGDLNGDGRADVIVAAPGQEVGGNSDQGRVYLFDGLTGAFSQTIDSPNPQASSVFGRSLSTGDVNADARGDILIGAPLEDMGAAVNGGHAYVFSALAVSTPSPSPSPSPTPPSPTPSPTALPATQTPEATPSGTIVAVGGMVELSVDQARAGDLSHRPDRDLTLLLSAASGLLGAAFVSLLVAVAWSKR